VLARAANLCGSQENLVKYIFNAEALANMVIACSLH